LLKPLGKGGFGQVWLAEHTTLPSVYRAVKLIHLTDPALRKSEQEGVLRYKQSMGACPYLVPIEEVGEVKRWFYYVTPLADDARGSSPIQQWQDYEPLTLEWYRLSHRRSAVTEVVTVADEILSAVESVHANNFLHCDIKPPNVLKIDGTWRLSDIGILCPAEDADGRAGTPWFAPPEGYKDRSGDLFALGRTMYLLLSGADPPHDEKTLTEAETKFQAFVSSSNSDPQFERLRLIIGRACAANPADRFRTAAEMRAAVQRVVDRPAVVKVSEPVAGEHVDSDLTLLNAYLNSIIATCSKLKTETILPGRAKPGSEPLQLDRVYIDLNIDLRVPQRMSLAEYLAAARKGREPLEREQMQREEKTRLVPVLEALALHPKLVLLGVAGSGKSTFASYVALSLAQARSGDATALQRLGPCRDLGPLLPVRVILREFADALPAGLDKGRAGHLWNFIETELERSGSPSGTARLLRNIAQGTGALFLLDGLDEAREQTTRVRILEAVAEFMSTAGQHNRFLLTARPYAWEDFKQSDSARSQSPAAVAQMPVAYRLADFEPDQINAFIDRWFPAVHTSGWLDEKAAADKTANLKQAVQRKDLQPLARNPLLLTLMASLLVGRERLPDDRTKLYHEAVELLLQRWNEPTKMDCGLLNALDIAGLAVEHLRGAIERVALAAHAAQTGGKPLADIPESDLKNELRPLLGNSDAKAELVLDYIEKRAGLLLCQGARNGQRLYNFPHLTFQEFLAGCCLEKRRDFEQETVRLAETGAPEHWHEVFRFAARRATASRGVPAADALVHHQDVDRRPVPPTERDWRRAMLAAEQLLEIGLPDVNSVPDQCVVRERVAGWLAALIEQSPQPVTRRAEAGVLLAKLGDPRPGVGVAANGLPDIDWIEIPPGQFVMGSRQGETRWADERPQFVCDVIIEPYQISRYPITVAQYGCFVKAGGYTTDKYWTNAGLKWRRDNNVTGPEDYQEVFQTANHPRVGVSWFEAAAFCNWLAEMTGLKIALPTEAQWERAARGTDGRKYPWGDEEECKQRCNMGETGIGHTSAVGLFPTGDAECGAADMAGNVWEWCENKYKEGEEWRVLRGASWDDYAPGRLLSSCRYNTRPGSRGGDVGFRCVLVVGSSSLR